MDTQIELHRVTKITKRVNTISAMEPETVPDTQTNLCLRCKIGKSIRVYSANTRNKYGVYRVYGVFGDLLYAAVAGLLQSNTHPLIYSENF